VVFSFSTPVIFAISFSGGFTRQSKKFKSK
jgi:hypothetical protein